MPDRLTSVKQLDFTPVRDVFPSPRDWRDQFFYQLLIDRFDDAKEHPPYDPKTAKRGRDVEQGKIFQGGKLKGITRRLDYIKGLGCTAIWISPPFKNRQNHDDYHGYAIQDFLSIDPRFGTLEDLQELTREAHERGLYVILDIVINHTGNNWAYPGDKGEPFDESGRYDFGAWRRADGSAGATEPFGPDDAVWPVELQDPDAYKRRGEIRNLAGPTEDERLHGDFFSLKEIDVNDPAVLDVLIKCHKHWIAAADVDGFRMDTVTNLDPPATAVFCNALREYAKRIGKQNFIIFGEIVGDDDLLKKYVGQNTPVPNSTEEYPVFDAALDFPLYAILEEAIKGISDSKALRDRYEHLRHYYRDYNEAGKHYITFVDNHDQSHRHGRRFMHQSGDSRQIVLAVAYLLTNMGIPCIYYGTEQAFDGGGDSDVYIREAMFGGTWGAFGTTGVHFFDPASPTYKRIAAVAKIRNTQPALRYGRQYFRDISGDGENFGCPTTGQCTLAFSRVLDTDEVLVALNLTAERREEYVAVDGTLTPPGCVMEDLLNGGEFPVEDYNGHAAVRLDLPAREIAVLKLKR